MDFIALAPEIGLALSALLLILLDLFLPERKKSARLSFAAGLGLSISLGLLLGLHFGGYQAASNFKGAFVSDVASVFFRAILLLSALLTIMISIDYVREKIRYVGEFYALVMLATLGAMFMVSAAEALTLYLSLELLSISSFVMVALRKDQPRSAEASIKYLIFGAVSSGILLYGFSLLYGITASLSFSDINTFLLQYSNDYLLSGLKGAFAVQNGHLRIELLAAILMVVGGLCYKIAAVPFHMWAPDVYEGAPLPVTAFLSVSSKIAGFAALMRVLDGLNSANTNAVWVNFLIIVAVLSMSYGNIVAIAQHNVKRLFAYSSIAHAGYLLLGVVALSTSRSRDTAMIGICYYLLVYLLANLGAFAVIIRLAQHTRSSRIQDWAGLGRQHPWFAFVFACCLLSLTGLPPFAGFTGKFYLFGAVTQMGNGYLWLVLVGLVNSVVSLYYYTRLLRTLFFAESEQPEATETAHPTLLLASLISVVGIVALFVFPSWVTNFVAQIHTLI